jgi:hypothetical protein
MVMHHHVPATFGQGERDYATYPFRGAGDECSFYLIHTALRHPF